MFYQHMRFATWASVLLVAFFVTFLSVRPANAAQVIGYWVADGSMPLTSISTDYDVVIISAGDLSGVDNATVTFDTGAYSPSEIISGIQTLHSRGQKVEFCFYSGNPTMQLISSFDVSNLETSLESIVDTYGFDGIDFDLESGTLSPGYGDTSIYNPNPSSSYTLVNMIQAVHDLKAHYGSSFMITTPPESEGVNSYSFWGNDFQQPVSWVSSWGDDVPFLAGIKDVLTFASAQEYLGLSAPYYGLDGNMYSPSGNAADFWASQAELLIDGYTLSTGENFAGLDPSQVVIGVGVYEGDPAGTLLQAMQYVGSGTPDGGSYVLRHPEGYPTIGGVMDWDINSDSGASWASTLAPYLHSLPGYAAAKGIPAPPSGFTATPTNEVTDLAWTYSLGATSYNVYRGTNPAGSDQTLVAPGVSPDFYHDQDLTPGTTYYYAVSSVNTNGESAHTTLTPCVFTVETAYGGTPSSLPGIVQSDNYDIQSGIGYSSSTTNTSGLYRPDGVALEACSDNDGNGNGYDVTDTAPGNWLKYSINATTSGQYTFTFRVASVNGATFHLQDVNGVAITGPITVPATGGAQVWQTVTATQIQPNANAWFYNIPAGHNIIELYEDTGGFSIEYMGFALQTPSTPAYLSASNGGGGINLIWAPSTEWGALNDGATFNVYRGTASGAEDYSNPIMTGVPAIVANLDCSWTDPTGLGGVTYYYTVKGVNSAGSSAPSNEASATVIGEGPYEGTPWPIAGIIDFDNYDVGGQGVGYNVTNYTTNQGGEYRNDAVSIETCGDTDGNGNGYDVGWTNTGNWLRYTVNVAQPGIYTVAFRVAAQTGYGGSFHLQDQFGNNLSGSVTAPVTGGWETWTTVNANVTFAYAGQQVIELYEDTGGYNLEYMNFTYISPISPTGLVAQPQGGGIALNWTSSPAGSVYAVYRTTSATSTASSALGYTSGTTYSDNGVVAGQTYYYYITLGTQGAYGAPSNVAPATAGATYFLDPFNNASLVYADSSNMVLGASDVESYFQDDPGIATRTNTATGTITYKQSNITTFDLKVFDWETPIASTLSFLSSDDGVNWQPVTVSPGAKFPTTPWFSYSGGYNGFGGWGYYDIIPTLPINANYLQVTINGPTANSWDPVFSQISIDTGSPVTPPTTSASVSGSQVGSQYVGQATVALSVTPGTLPVANTYYTLDSGGQQTYSTAFNVTSAGGHVLTYWSTDVEGNAETAHTVIFTIGDITLTSLSPTSAPVGPQPVITMIGQNFVSGCTVLVNGTSYSVKRNSSTSLTFTMPSSKMSKTHVLSLQVQNPGAGGTSNALNFTVYDTAPTTTATLAGTEVSGAYVGEATVTLTAVGGTAPVAATYYTLDGGTQQTYSAPFAVSGLGSHTLNYWSVDTLGGTEAENTLTFSVSAPTITSLTPSSAPVGVQPKITITGVGFVSGATVVVNGTSYSATYDNSTTLTFTMPSSKMNKTYILTVQVQNPAPGGETNGLPFAVTDTPPATTATATGITDNGNIVNTATVTITATDATYGVGGIYYTLDGGQAQTYTAPFAVLAVGSHTVVYWATATDGTPSAQQSLAFVVQLPQVISVSFSPSTLCGGLSTTGTVTVAVAPLVNETITATPSDANATVVGPVVVPAGQTSTTFTVNTSVVSAKDKNTITVQGGGTTTKSAYIDIEPIYGIYSVHISPTSVVGGTSTTGTVTLTAPAAANQPVTVTTSDGNATVGTVIVPAGQNSTTFTINTSAVTANDKEYIYATADGVQKSAYFTITP